MARCGRWPRSRADAALIDGVALAHLRRLRPWLIEPLRGAVVDGAQPGAAGLHRRPVARPSNPWRGS